jgi:hypothetical protein
MDAHIKEVMDLYNRLTSFDVISIIHCNHVLRKFKERLSEI